MKNHPAYQLIKKLSKSEKRYFKISARQQGEGKLYEKLFDYIDSNDNHTDREISVLFKRNDPGSNIAIHKNYLYHALLDSMVNYNSKKSQEGTLYHDLLQLEYLHRKDMKDAAIKKLKMAKADAMKCDYFGIYFHLLLWERKFMLNSWDSKNLEAWNLEQKKINDKANLVHQCMHIHDSLFMMAQGSRGFTSGLIKKLYLQLERLKTSPAHTFSSEKYLLGAFLSFYHLVKQPDKLFEASSGIINLYVKYPQFIIHDTLNYTRSINNYLLSCLHNGKIRLFEQTLPKLKALSLIKKVPDPAKKNAISSYYLNHVNRYVISGEFNKCSQEMTQIIKGWKEVEKPDEWLKRLAFWTNISIIHFGTGDYKAALRILHYIKTEKIYGNLPASNYFILNVMRLLIYYELGRQNQWIELKETMEAEAKLLQPNSFEQIVLTHFNLLNNISESEKTRRVLKSLSKKLLQIYIVPELKIYFDTFDLLLWVNGKLENKSYQQKVMEAFRKQVVM